MAAVPPRIEGSFRIAADHPCFAGHFPGRPLVPGVVLLDEIFGVLGPLLPEGAVPALDAAKFLRPVLPDCEVSVEALLTGHTARFLATVAGVPVVSGTAKIG